MTATITTVQCECGAKLRVPPGKSGKCPKCGARIGAQPEPYELADEPAENPKPRRPRPVTPPGVNGLAITKSGLIGLGTFLVFVGLNSGMTTHMAAWAGVACFLGITARIFQAEEHRLRDGK